MGAITSRRRVGATCFQSALARPKPSAHIMGVRRRTREKVGSLFDGSLELVFCDDAGGIMDVSNLRRRHFAPLCRAAGLPQGTTLYPLRQSVASNLVTTARVDVRTAAARLGDTDRGQTLIANYAHLIDDAQERAAQALAAALFESGEERAPEIGPEAVGRVH